MKIILDELTAKEFFTNGGVVKIYLEDNEIKKMYKRNKFLFYEYREYTRFLRELYLRYLTKLNVSSSVDACKKVNSSIRVECRIGTKEYVIDPNFDGVKSLEFCNFYYCYDNDSFERKQNDKIDVYGVPNVNFSLVGVDDSKWEVYQTQRLMRGFDDSELWCLNKTIVGFILPRLKVFREKHCSTPENMSKEEWNSVLDKMIVSFELLLKEENTNEEKLKIDSGLRLFSRYLEKLWD